MSPSLHKQSSKHSAVGSLFFIIGLTALTGFLREAVLAAQFGIGQETDAFFFAYGLIQMLNDLLFNGSLSASVIPLLRPLVIDESRDTARARAAFTTTLTVIVLAAAALLSLLVYASLPAIIAFLSPSMETLAQTRTLHYGRILVFLLPVQALLTLFTLILNAHNRYRMAAAIYLGANIVFISIILFSAKTLGDTALPLAGLAGPLLLIPLLILKLRRMDLLRLRTISFNRAFLRSIGKLSWPSLASFGIGSSLGLLMASHMILRGAAAEHGAGGISALGYAFRLYEAPLSVLVNPVATLVFPAVVALFAARNLKAFTETCRNVLVWGAVLMVPVAIATYAGAEIVIFLMLQRGNFSAEAMQLTSVALKGFAPAIVFEAVFVIFFRIYYALHRPQIPVIVAFATLLFLAALLYGVKPESLFGTALSLSASFAFAAALLLIELRRRIGSGLFPKGAIVARWLLTLVVSGTLAASVDHWLGAGMMQRTTSLSLFALLYVALGALLLPELWEQARAALRARAWRKQKDVSSCQANLPE